jgi:hypothetical protein
MRNAALTLLLMTQPRLHHFAIVRYRWLHPCACVVVRASKATINASITQAAFVRSMEGCALLMARSAGSRGRLNPPVNTTGRCPLASQSLLLPSRPALKQYRGSGSIAQSAVSDAALVVLGLPQPAPADEGMTHIQPPVHLLEYPMSSITTSPTTCAECRLDGLRIRRQVTYSERMGGVRLTYG